MKRRAGRFFVHHDFFQENAQGEVCGANLFKDMVVLQVLDRNWYIPDGKVEYLALHPDFEPIDRGMVVPEYDAVFEEGSIYPKWVKVESGV